MVYDDDRVLAGIGGENPVDHIRFKYLLPHTQLLSNSPT